MMNPAELEKIILQKGFVFIRVGKGHAIYKKGEITISIPRHKFIRTGTYNQICKKAGLNGR